MVSPSLLLTSQLYHSCSQDAFAGSEKILSKNCCSMLLKPQCSWGFPAAKTKSHMWNKWERMEFMKSATFHTEKDDVSCRKKKTIPQNEEEKEF